jgi:hypothetical protein
LFALCTVVPELWYVGLWDAGDNKRKGSRNTQRAKRSRGDEGAPSVNEGAATQVRPVRRVAFDRHIAKSIGGKNRWTAAYRNTINDYTAPVTTNAEQEHFWELWDKHTRKSSTSWGKMAETFNRQVKTQRKIQDPSELLDFKTPNQLKEYEKTWIKDMRARNATIHIDPEASQCTCMLSCIYTHKCTHMFAHPCSYACVLAGLLDDHVEYYCFMSSAHCCVAF